MIRKNTKISKLIGTLILSIFIIISSVNITFAVEKDEKTPGGSTGSSGQTVTIPPIIPPTDNPKTGYKEKIYIPINVSG
ncbi:hypothetical protein IT412_00160, partial [Candidatus Peregrinibacteria bacterium]|nr:hypothetical protein [Candidatus Peregrinibacteria bacterium]